MWDSIIVLVPDHCLSFYLLFICISYVSFVFIYQEMSMNNNYIQSNKYMYIQCLRLPYSVIGVAGRKLYEKTKQKKQTFFSNRDKGNSDLGDDEIDTCDRELNYLRMNYRFEKKINLLHCMNFR